MKPETPQETEMGLRMFKINNLLEFGKVCEELSWNHCTSTPHRSETNGIAERAVRRIKEGTSAVLLQSGLGEKWRADSVECYLRNVQDLLSEGKTPYERRFREPIKGPVISFGCTVEYHPISANDQSRLHQFGKTVQPGIFTGYSLYAWKIWQGDILLADLEEMDNLDASEIHPRKLNAKDVITTTRGEHFIFPIADGTAKLFGRDHGKACEELSWNHCTSEPHRSETNGIAERAVRRIKEGTSAVLFTIRSR